MPAPGILTGGNTRETLFSTGEGTSARSRLGVFGPNPGSTSKSALNSTNSPGRDAEYRETMARLFIEAPGDVTQLLSTVSAEALPLMRVLLSGGVTGGSGATGFVDFLMTNANEQFAEKAQIVDTLTDNYVAFYAGQQPPVFTYSGTVLNTYQDDQRVWMLRMYREILRGTRLAGRNLIARLRYDSFIVSGYLESLSLQITGETEHTAGTFQFTMRVQRMSVFTPSLALPTIVTSIATDSSSLTAPPSETDPDTQRVATVTPEVPPTATDGPGGGLQVGVGFTSRAIDNMHAAGFTDEQIETIRQQAQRSAQAEASVSTDPREAAVIADAQGLDRLAAATASSTRGGSTSRAPDADINPGNVSEDGADGTTNIYGDIYVLRTGITPSDAIPRTRPRAGPRTRGQFLAESTQAGPPL